MNRTLKIVVVTLAAVAVLGGIAGAVYLMATGLSARPSPGALETALARAARRFAVPRTVRNMTNPISASPGVIAAGRSHFADHCAQCHANDGSGNTEIGQGLFPKPPNMATVSQELTDGELFHVIEHGIRFTGMPAFGTGTPAGEEASWHLVHFIRQLPRISTAEVEEMEAMNPRSPVDVRQEIEAERFLQGDDVVPSPPAAPAHEH